MTSLKGLPMLAKNRAKYIIEKLGISRPEDIDLAYIAWELKTAIKETPLHGYDGRIVKFGKQAVISVNRAIVEPSKKRFVVAHELGHLQLEHEVNQLALCSENDLALWQKGNSDEQDSNIFASELLMPELIFRPFTLTDPSPDMFREITEKFQTSLTASLIRYATLTSDRVAVIFSKDQSIKWVQASDNFGYYIEIGARLNSRTHAVDFFNGSDLSKKFENIEAFAWINDRKIRSDAFVKELSISMPRYNSVISVVWLDKPIEDDYGEQ
ncbi:MAG: ImmA/IrrE family metallo-endopeptidase [Elusimicrobia bacterium]|nr:ImmA/IrrE family metallo-endopeptidase [Elusimicrobiota bacterium]